MTFRIHIGIVFVSPTDTLINDRVLMAKFEVLFITWILYVFFFPNNQLRCVNRGSLTCFVELF